MVVFEVADLIIGTAMADPEEKLIVYAEMWPLQYDYDSRSLSPAFNKLVFFLSQWNWAYDTLYFDQLLSRSNELRRPWCLSQCALKNKTWSLLDFPVLCFQSQKYFLFASLFEPLIISTFSCSVRYISTGIITDWLVIFLIYKVIMGSLLKGTIVRNY